jgi:hypothetical protein
VSGFEQEFAGRVHAQNVDATTTESVRAIKSLGFKNHGLVIRSAHGKVLWKQADHAVKIEEVREAIERLLKSRDRARRPPRPV